ncbi:MAG: O-antigen ligase family protein [Elusimicrobia bacterium]|nr:O-antigen ligase family protein [Elusimicrobiota bacterium]
MVKTFSEKAEPYGLPFFLCLSMFLGGLRTSQSWFLFSILFSLYVVFFKNKIKFCDSGPWLFFLVWLLAASVFSVDILNSFGQFGRYLMYALFFAIASNQSGNKNSVFAWKAVLVSAGFVSAFMVWLQFLLGKPLTGFLYPNPNYTAAVIVSGLCFLLPVSFKNGSLKLKVFASALTLFLVATLVLINSRGAYAALALALFVFFLYEKKYFGLFGFAVFGILLLALIPENILNIALKTGDVNSFQRLNIWNTALETTKEYPFFGIGPGCFEKAFLMFKFPAFNGVSYYGHHTHHAHSEILNLSSEAGLPAAVLFLFAFAQILRASGRNRAALSAIGAESAANGRNRAALSAIGAESAANGRNRAALSAIGAESAANGRRTDSLKIVAIALFSQACFDVIFYLGSISMIFWGTLGYCLERRGETEKDEGQSMSRVRALIAVFFILAGNAAKFKYENYRQCLSSQKAGCVDKALNLFPDDADVISEKIKMELLNGEKTNLARVLAFVRKIQKQMPKSAPLKLIESNIYFETGDLDNAARSVLDAVAVEPNFLQARLHLAKIFLKKGNVRSAAKEIDFIRNRAALSAIGAESAANGRNSRETSVKYGLSNYDKMLLRFDDVQYAKIKAEIEKKQQEK